MIAVMAWRRHATVGFWTVREEIMTERRDRKNNRSREAPHLTNRSNG